MSEQRIQQILELTRHEKVIRSRDLDRLGIPRVYLGQLQNRGLLKRIGRGMYVSSDAEFSQNHSLAEASKRVPHGVVCLLSALQFHELTTQFPYEVWMAIPQKSWTPQVDWPRMRFHRFSGQALKSGIETHLVEGIDVRVYNPPKTVADCFKFRNKIGLDIAIEALKDCYKQKKAHLNDLWHYAQICRMSNVMKPYLEMLV